MPRYYAVKLCIALQNPGFPGFLAEGLEKPNFDVIFSSGIINLLFDGLTYNTCGHLIAVISLVLSFYTSLYDLAMGRGDPRSSKISQGGAWALRFQKCLFFVTTLFKTLKSLVQGPVSRNSW